LWIGQLAGSRRGLEIRGWGAISIVFELLTIRQIYVDMSLGWCYSSSLAFASGLRVDTKKSTDLTGCQYMEDEVERFSRRLESEWCLIGMVFE
jgi:hypothetical protein